MTITHCVTRERLKEYLAGWADQEQSDQIESHLSDCEECEQTIVSLESDPDTLVEFVRSGTAVADESSVLASALSNARNLKDASVFASGSKAANWEPPKEDVGAYELLEPLGQGGMGSVYLARHRQLGKLVAIKLLPARSFRNDLFAARFQREIRAAGGLDHPAIVKGTDAGEHNGTHYLVMEHIDGMDLSRIARATGQFSIPAACEIVRQVALGLSYAHSVGVVHRDVKPSNLMLNAAGDAKILDFGLARVGPWDEGAAELTSVGQLMGTLDYMAPEQAERADSVDYRADLYSLGATLFRLLTGRAPLAASPDLSPLAKLRLLATQDAPRIDTLRTDVPPALANLIEQLLARSPDSRPASAAHVAQAIETFCDGQELEALLASALSKQDLLPEETLPQFFPASLPAASAETPRRSLITWLALAAGIPAAIFASIMIVLETQKGQLVIQSDAEVQVQLVKDGSAPKELQIVPGANTTRLFAGKYEVIIASGSDSVQLDESQFTIQRGDTSIARITRKLPAKTELLTALSLLPASTDALKPGDALKIKSLAAEELVNCEVVVMADSTIKVPLVGTVDVQGETISQLRRKLEKKYSEHIRTPSIDVLPSVDYLERSALLAGTLSRVPPASTAELAPGDCLRISSLTDETIESRVIVLADLKGHFPLIGTVSVSGMSVDELEDQLEESYSTILKHPAIQLFRDFSITSGGATGGNVASTKTESNDSSIVESGPVYDGQPLSHWLTTVERERSPEALGAAFDAISALVSRETSPTITQTLLELLPGLEGKLRVDSITYGINGQGESIKQISKRTMDERGFAILRAANPDRAFAILLAAELEKGDGQWKRRVFGSSYLAGEDYEPIVDWVLKNLFSGGQDEELVREAGSYCAELAQYVADAKAGKEIVAKLADCPQLGPDFWLALYPQFAEEAKPFVREQFVKTALAQIRQPKNNSLLAQALILLTASSDWMLDAVPEQLGVSINNLIRRMDPDAIFENKELFVDIGKNYRDLVSPRVIQRPSGTGFSATKGPNLSFRFQGPAKAIVMVELLRFAEAHGVDVRDSVKTHAQRTKDSWEAARNYLSGYQVGLYWPSLKMHTLRNLTGRGAGSSRAASNAGAASLQPNQWVEYFIYDQIQSMYPDVYAPKEPEVETPPSRQQAIEAARQRYLERRPSSTSQSVGRILYQGRSLDDWMRIIPLEKSESGIEEALIALNALVTDESSDYIADYLCKELPKMQMLVCSLPSKNGKQTSVGKAFEILRRVKSDAYYSYLAEQLAGGGKPEFKMQILRSAIPSDQPLESLEAILPWIEMNCLQEVGEFTPAGLELLKNVANSPNRSAEDAETLIAILRDCAVVGQDDSYWLGSVFSSSSAKVRTGQAWSNEVATRAMKIMEESSSRELRVKALRTLDALCSGSSPACKIDATRLAVLVRTRLRSLLHSGDDIFASVSVRPPFDWPNPVSYSRFFKFDLFPLKTEVGNVTELRALLHLTRVNPSSAIKAADLPEADFFVAEARDIAKRVFNDAVAFGISVREQDLWAPEDAQLKVSLSYRKLAINRIVFQWPIPDDAKQDKFSTAQLLSHIVFYECLDLLADNGKDLYGRYLDESRKAEIAKSIRDFDNDENQSLSYQEFAKLKKSKQGIYLRVASLIDSNSDEQISHDELMRYRVEKGRLPQIGGSQMDWAFRQIARYDTSGDGVLTSGEWNKMPIKPTGADADGDGRITVTEYAEYRARLKTK